MVLENNPVQEKTLRASVSQHQNVQGVVMVLQDENQHGLHQAIIAQLQHAGFETLSLNLLSRGGDKENDSVTQQRLLAATRWIQKTVPTLPLGFFVTGVNAATALKVSLTVPARALVAVAGRFDVAETVLGQVRVPTLLIVGSQDEVTLEHNRHVLKQLHCEKQLADVPGATHSFSEPGAIETIATLTAHWFNKHFATL